MPRPLPRPHPGAILSGKQTSRVVHARIVHLPEPLSPVQEKDHYLALDGPGWT